MQLKPSTTCNDRQQHQTRSCFAPFRCRSDEQTIFNVPSARGPAYFQYVSATTQTLLEIRPGDCWITQQFQRAEIFERYNVWFPLWLQPPRPALSPFFDSMCRVALFHGRRCHSLTYSQEMVSILGLGPHRARIDRSPPRYMECTWSVPFVLGCFTCSRAV